VVAKHFYREELANTNKSDFPRQSGKLISGLGSSNKKRIRASSCGSRSRKVRTWKEKLREKVDLKRETGNEDLKRETARKRKFCCRIHTGVSVLAVKIQIFTIQKNFEKIWEWSELPCRPQNRGVGRIFSRGGVLANLS